MLSFQVGGFRSELEYLMRVVPFYSAWGVMIFVVRVFLWKLLGVRLFVIYISLTVLLLLYEVGFRCEWVHRSGFLIFIIIEFLTFYSLFVVSHYSMSEGLFESIHYISDFTEFPFLGSIVLISSSILVTGFHYKFGLKKCNMYLLGGIILGCFFIIIQFVEFNDSSFYFVDCPYYVIAYSTVGLHFLHVVGGLIALWFVYRLGSSLLKYFYVEMVVWYWHFVDCVWLLVFFVFYYPSKIWLSLFFFSYRLTKTSNLWCWRFIFW